MKRLISLLLALCMMISIVPVSVFAVTVDSSSSDKLSNSFTDVKENDWFFDSVQYSRVNGIFNGVSDTEFEPNGVMTRGMFVTVLGRMAGVDAARYEGQSAFTDVAADEYYAPYVAWAAKHGITLGTGDGCFSPDATLDRQQMATLIVRYFDIFGADYSTDANVTTVPADLDKVEDWAKDAVLKLWKQGLLNGDGTSFNPADNATRSQAATLAQRVDDAVVTWYKEPGVASSRVRLDPATGRPYVTVNDTPLVPALSFCTVRYTDGVDGEELFGDQLSTVIKGIRTPNFAGTPMREGYTFDGWDPAVETSVTSDITYTALWTVNQYTITFANTGDSVISPITLDYAAAITAPSDPIRDGYTFAGWDKPIPEKMPAGNVTVAALWTPNSYTVTFDTQGGTLDNGAASSQTVVYDSPYDLPTASKEGWTFKGWYLADGETQISTGDTVKITAPTELTAKWEVGPGYSISYDLGGGSLSVANPAGYNVATETFTLNNPTKEGYTFTGWSGTGLTGSDNMTVTVPVGSTGNRTYTANWKVNEYTITFVTGEGATQIAPITQNYGTAVTSPEAPVKTGYTFAGWDVEFPATMPAGDITLMAKWTVNQYTITFVDTGDNSIPPIVQDYGSDITVPADPTKQLYKFLGWDKEIPATMPAENITVTATWEQVIFTVSFYDGERLIDTLYAEKGQPVGAVPAVTKSSKENATLAGYFTDAEFTTHFYADTPVNDNISVYAKYEQMPDIETVTLTSFAQIDAAPDISFDILGSGNPVNGVTLEVMDGSSPVELAFTRIEGGYNVKAKKGFNPGASYQLHLADGWTFRDKAESVRTASFSIFMEEVENLRMNDDIVYIKDTDSISYNIGGGTYDVLTTSLITSDIGSFGYNGADMPEAGDIICIYVGTHPAEREGNADTLDPAVYVKTVGVHGGTITFTQLSAEDQLDLYEIPDNFPIIVAALPASDLCIVSINALDAEMYATMMGEGYDLASAKLAIEVGDFVTLYVSQEEINSESDLYYGEITAYNSVTGEITFKRTTRQAILDSMDLYSMIDVEGSDLITDEEKEELETELLKQVEDSGFAEDAAFLLADMITKTNGFANGSRLEDLVIKDANGNPLTADQLELLNLGGTFEMSDDVKLTVELITKGDQLHFNGGVQLAIGIEAEFEVELVDDDKITIELSATFVQEVMIDPRVSGSIVYKEILWIPIPVGVRVSSTIDVKNFTAFSFEAVVYSVAAEEEEGWDKFKSIAKSTIKDLGIKIPDELIKGMETVKDVTDKIKELEELANEVKDNYEQYTGYMEDVAELWAALEDNGITTKEDWNAMRETFEETSIASDLLSLMDLTNETGLSTEYYDSMEALLDRYCEMLEQESDWVKLVEQEIYKYEYCFYGVVIGVEVNFVVRTDLSLAIGSNLEYEVGKRYTFWFEIGLFKPSAGSSTMDLLDERFAFQFYVMGRLGLKAGIQAEFYVGIGSGDLASVGITCELGPYIKIYGFFVYEYTKLRPANTTNWQSKQRMGGALYLEFGMYLIIGFEAEALGLFEYSHDFVDEEFPLLEAGKKRYYYKPEFMPEEGEVVVVRDADKNSTNGITMQLPTYYLGLKFIDLTNGLKGVDEPEYDEFNYSVSNPNFKIDPKTGVISVNVPNGVRYMECELTLTYKYAKASFSTYDMTIVVPLVWTNMSTSDLTEYYTASVRVGNDTDGYDIVWNKRTLKNKQYDLPSKEEIVEIIEWNEYRHVMGTGYNTNKLNGLVLVEDMAYDFNIDYKTYSITVNGVQNADGTVGSRTYYADFGEAFDFSDLTATGTTDYANGVFTAFKGLHVEGDVDITRTINSKLAKALTNGITVTAEYASSAVTATFVFDGIDIDDMEVKLRRGDIPTITSIENAIAAQNLSIIEIYPAIGVMNSSTTYHVVCGELKTPDATITFVENGGSEVEDITMPYGGFIGVLPTPERTGYNFVGWYVDDELIIDFTATRMPEEGATLYAAWTAAEYTVTFHVNGGNPLDNGTITVTYGSEYGALPKANRTNYGFIGWFTAQTGGEQISAKDIYTLTENQTVYAQWRVLSTIDAQTAFDFGERLNVVYEYGKTYTAEDIGYTASLPEGVSIDDFTFEFLAEGYEDEDYIANPMEAGTWGVKIIRPADDYFAKFEYFYSGVLIIEKAYRDLINTTVKQVDNGLTYIEYKLTSEIFDLDPNARITYAACTKMYNNITVPVSDSEPTPYGYGAKVFNLTPGTEYDEVFILVSGDRNYFDIATYHGGDYYTNKTDSDNWNSYISTYWYSDSSTTMYISDESQLAGLAELVNSGTSFAGKTIILVSDLDLSAHDWTPIGTATKPFKGTFDGDGHTIKGVYVNKEGTPYIGLFGVVESTVVMKNAVLNNASATPAVIKNVVLDDSYIVGKNKVGGIVGSATVEYTGAGSLFAMLMTSSTGVTRIENCTNYACVKAVDNTAGGIVGYLEGGVSAVRNCVNYGNVTVGSSSAGGIVGGSYVGLIDNCANFGTVTGTSVIGGIVGISDSLDIDGSVIRARVYNCYTIGTVYASGDDYVGAVCGRNVSDDGYVKYNYYLKGSATANDRLGAHDALGCENGFVIDGNKGYDASSFESPSTKLRSTAGVDYSGLKLIEALNKWVGANGKFGAASWTENGPKGYPLPSGSFVSDLRD